MNKGQSGIVSIVLMSGIAIIIVASILIWGKPLIDKSSDKISMQNIINTLEKVDGKIVYVASNTGSQQVRIDITGLSDILVDEGDNSIIFKTETRAPLVGSRDWVPLNTYELPTENEVITLTTATTACTCGSCPAVYQSLCGSGAVHTGAKTINGTASTATLISTNGLEYNKVCLNSTAGIPSLNCNLQNNDILFNNVPYKIVYIDPAGSEAVIQGGEIENVGVQGRDIPGIVSGKLASVEGMYEVRLRLKYRGLEDENGITHKIRLVCGKNCAYSSGKTTFMKISYNSTDTTTTSSETYIKVEFE